MPLFAPTLVQAPPRPADLFVKREFMVPMRDGVRLYTAVYVPKNRTEKSPLLLSRTPYSAGPYGPDRLRNPGAKRLVDAGYAFVFQDVRGKFMSEGEFVNVRPIGPKGSVDESSDTYDTVDFLIKNVPESNGRVGITGISYPGFYAGAGAVDGHPALVAASPQAPVSDWYVGDDFHRNGVFFLQDGFDFLSGFGTVRPLPTPTPEGLSFPKPDGDAYKFFLEGGSPGDLDDKYFKGRVPFWKDMMDHPDYDAWWKARSLTRTTRGVRAAMLHVGGWFDAEDCWGALNLFAANEKVKRGRENHLVMGPWYHGMWARGTGATFGDLVFDGPTSEWYQENVEFPFWERHLRGRTDAARIAKATVYETGRNRWRAFSKWPPATRRTPVALSEGGRLVMAGSGRGKGDTYVNDPAAPTPYQIPVPIRRSREYMIADQRPFEGRPDVLVYRSEPLKEALTVAGPMDVEMWIKTDGTDADIVAKVIDEYPADAPDRSPKGESMASYQLLVRGDIMRARYRRSLERPEPVTPGRPTKVKFRMTDGLHTFRAGHRIMVQIQSNWFPLADRNPNRFMDTYRARPEDYRKATITVLHDAAHPSKVTFGALER